MQDKWFGRHMLWEVETPQDPRDPRDPKGSKGPHGPQGTPGTPGMTEEIWLTCTDKTEYSISVSIPFQCWWYLALKTWKTRVENMVLIPSYQSGSKTFWLITGPSFVTSSHKWMFRRCWKHSSGDTYIGSFSKTSVWKNYLIILIVYRIWLEDVARNWVIPARSI